MKRAIQIVGAAVIGLMLAVMILVALASAAQLVFPTERQAAQASPVFIPAQAVTAWPGEQQLWGGSTQVTTTAQTRGTRMLGAPIRHLFFSTGLASATATLTITVNNQWNGITFSSAVQTATVNALASVSGMMTIATTAPYYPHENVQVQMSTGILTPTISLVGE
jgi:hypothetical protein